MKSALVVLVILWTLLPTHAQTAKTTPENAFTPQQLQQDFGLTRQLFERMHPALYDVIAKEKLDHMWDSTSRLLDHKLTAFEFFNLLSPIISQLGCGHTGIFGRAKPRELSLFRFNPSSQF